MTLLTEEQVEKYFKAHYQSCRERAGSAQYGTDYYPLGDDYASDRDEIRHQHSSHGDGLEEILRELRSREDMEQSRPIPTGLQTPVGSDYGDYWNYQGAAIPGETISVPPAAPPFSPARLPALPLTQRAPSSSMSERIQVQPIQSPRKEFTADLAVRSLRSFTGHHTSFFELDRTGHLAVAQEGRYYGEPIKQQWYYDKWGKLQTLYPEEHLWEGQRGPPDPYHTQRDREYRFHADFSYEPGRYPGTREGPRSAPRTQKKDPLENPGYEESLWASMCEDYLKSMKSKKKKIPGTFTTRFVWKPNGVTKKQGQMCNKQSLNNSNGTG